MNIFEALRKDHETHRTLADLVAKTHGDSEGRAELFARLKSDVLAHAAAEERTLYSLMLGREMTRDKGAHSVKEHQEAEKHFEKLDEMGFDNPNWVRSFEILKHDLIHHMDEEEHGVFQLAGREMNEKEKTDLAREFETYKAEELDKRR